MRNSISHVSGGTNCHDASTAWISSARPCLNAYELTARASIPSSLMSSGSANGSSSIAAESTAFCHCGDPSQPRGNGVSDVCDFCLELWLAAGEPELCPCDKVQDEFTNLPIEAVS